MMCNGYFPHTKSCLKTKDEHVNQETIRFIRLPSMVFLCSYPNTNIVIGKNFLGTKYLHALRTNEEKE